MDTDATVPGPEVVDEVDLVEVAGGDAPVRAPSTGALTQLEAELAELESELAVLEAGDGGES